MGLSLFKSKNLLYLSKKILHTSCLRPILTYGCETWATAKENYRSISISERKILKKIYGPLYNGQKERYEKRHNNKIQDMYGGQIAK